MIIKLLCIYYTGILGLCVYMVGTTDIIDILMCDDTQKNSSMIELVSLYEKNNKDIINKDSYNK